MSKNKVKVCAWSLQFCFAGLGYGAIEILWRGYTHISMLLLGGICFWALCQFSKTRYCLLVKTIIGGLLITAGEFLTGCVVNLWLKMDVWDYTQEVGQCLGQVCIRFSMLWCLLCSLVMPICQLARDKGKLYARQAVSCITETFSNYRLRRAYRKSEN